MTIDQKPSLDSSGFDGVRSWLASVLSNPICERVIIGVIVLNAITLGLDTSKTINASFGSLLSVVDTIILAIFVVEIVARMVAFGARFWRDPWSIFDFLVVAVTLLPATGNLSILRALRIIRALRSGLGCSLSKACRWWSAGGNPSMGSVILLLLLVNYIFAVMGTKLFADDFPVEFGTIGASFFTFFQIMTLEGWAQEIVRPVMDKYPWAWLLFIPYIVFVVFAVLNLFIGIIVDAMQNQSEEDREAQMEAAEDEHKALMLEVGALRAEVQAMRAETASAIARLSGGQEPRS